MKKRWISLLLMAVLIFVSACSNDNQNVHQDDKYGKDGKIKIIEYGDFKCPYCKKVEENIMPKLKKEYIDTKKVDYQFVNMAFLGKDSIIGSRAGHAVKQYAPKQYLNFQKLMFKQQPKSEENWITEQLVDQQINQLEISNDKKEKIKTSYKTKESKSWKAAEQDHKQYKENHIETAPTVFIAGKKVEDPYKYKNYKKILEES
ncbi:thioredoxin domain-containing protein [Staphylococcus cohnii]|uniref:Protein-disulfide isomerase n=3 Tax=Staphylococcus cohnii TaxID=29382 RepID=A0A2T4LS65_9STAP|nr:MULTISPECIES: DsbA family protein [Staphylococcus]MBA1353906.1 thioredoxin domain-containing protein [Staphylococcus cohnii]MBA1390279.1 thioredoxin domain-containing protein [Staphylococcus cohnii]MBZ8173573.1 DsbA family protein [Staphylococcus cohnii]MCE5032886.1 DsbA family protein [Staphylococcus cohnii]MSU29731.1 DsbA family protein [Staphylococcus sp. McC-251-APC-3A2]